MYDEAPDAESVVAEPAQTVLCAAEADNGNVEFTVTVTVAVEEQLPMIPVTVYVVVVVGDTEMLLPLKLPGIHVYAAAPVAVSVVDPPIQTLLCAADAVTTGDGDTLSTNVAVALHPPVVPVTV